jgi:hypothetical protein
MASGSAKPTASSKYHGSAKSVPKDPSPSRSGAEPPVCYPPTIDFASQPEQTNNLVEQGMKSRRPGGVRRGKGPWSTDPEGFSKTNGEFRSPAKSDRRSPHTSP